jgi:hypothetical protein
MSIRRALLGPALALAFAGAVQAQDFADGTRFELRLSAFDPEAQLRLSGDGTATDGEQAETLSGAGSVDIDGRWRPRGEFVFHMTPRQFPARELLRLPPQRILAVRRRMAGSRLAVRGSGPARRTG